MRPEREPVRKSRDLALPGRMLRSALALLDHVNPCDRAPAEIAFDELEAEGWVSGMLKMRSAMEYGLNARRREAWRRRYGAAHAQLALSDVSTMIEALKADIWATSRPAWPLKAPHAAQTSAPAAEPATVSATCFCVFAGCSQPALIGRAFCTDHAPDVPSATVHQLPKREARP